MDLDKKLKEFVYTEQDSILPGLDFTRAMNQNVHRQASKSDLQRSQKPAVYLSMATALTVCTILVILSQIGFPHLTRDMIIPSSSTKTETKQAINLPKMITAEEITVSEFMSQKIVRQALERIYRVYPETRSFPVQFAQKQKIVSLGGIEHDYYFASLYVKSAQTETVPTLSFRLNADTGELQEVRFAKQIKGSSVSLSEEELKRNIYSFLSQLHGEEMAGYDFYSFDAYTWKELAKANIPSVKITHPTDDTKPAMVFTMTPDTVHAIILKNLQDGTKPAIVLNMTLDKIIEAALVIKN